MNSIQLGPMRGAPGAAAAAAAPPPAPKTPDVEWWDARLLRDPSSYAANLDEASGEWAVQDGKVTLYVEHPVPIEPPAEGPPPAAAPLMLTTKVRLPYRQLFICS